MYDVSSHGVDERMKNVHCYIIIICPLWIGPIDQGASTSLLPHKSRVWKVRRHTCPHWIGRQYNYI